MCPLTSASILVAKVWYSVEFVLFRLSSQVWFSLTSPTKTGGAKTFTLCVVNCFHELVYDNLSMRQKRSKKFYWLHYSPGSSVVVGSCTVVVKYSVVVDIIISCAVVFNGIVVMGIVVMGVEAFMDGSVPLTACSVGVIVHVYIVT